MTMTEQVKAWCYRQCELQHATTESDIAGMEAAWNFAEYMTHSPGRMIGIGVMRDLASMIDPVANPGGRFRTGPAVFWGGGTAMKANLIEENLNRLLNALNTNDQMTPNMFYQELMYCHPFKDGNGRLGSLVYNMLNGTINNPVDPPDYR